LAWLWLWATPAASLALRSHIESRFAAVPVLQLPTAEAIVVLGGSVMPPGAHDRSVDLRTGADRVWHAARLYKAGKAPLVLLSGGSDSASSAMSEAQAMQVFLRDLGVPDGAMMLEQGSRNTRQNAEFSSRLLYARGLHRILLVTSAIHMERARREFTRAGLEVIPAATDFEAGPPPPAPWRYLPDAGSLEGSARAIKELVGQWVVCRGPCGTDAAST
jgi:uncharacterized SAM-binding protein YcdF (DUF218 family)